MKIAFVQDIIQFSVPLGTTLIAGNLRKGGHEVELFVCENNLDKTLQELKVYKPDAVAFSVITGSHLEYIKIARIIKQKLNSADWFIYAIQQRNNTIKIFCADKNKLIIKKKIIDKKIFKTSIFLLGIRFIY